MRWLPLILLLTACEATPPGPCEAAIPADAVVVRDLQTAEDGRAYWVCDGGELSVNAGDVTVFVESGGTAQATSGTWELYVRSGGSLVVDAGEGTVYAEEGSNAVVNAELADIRVCRPVRLDTADAPDPGC